MALIQAREGSPSPRQAPDLWYVSNGELIVGPVPTDTLLRGITHGRVPEDCWVKQPAWTRWRGISRLREFATLDRAPLWSRSFDDLPSVHPEPALPVLSEARFLGETFLLALNAIMSRTAADVGLVHRMRPPFVGLVTSSAHGPRMSDLLGEVIPSYDAALAAARAGSCALGRPNEGEVEAAVARRFAMPDQPPLHGVAMVPVRVGNELLAMIELGRFDHPLREKDLSTTREVAAEALVRLVTLAQAS